MTAPTPDASAGRVTLDADCRRLRLEVGHVAWLVLEDLALDAQRTDGRLVARSSVAKLAGRIAVAPSIVVGALARLRAAGVVSRWAPRQARGRFGASHYVLEFAAGSGVTVAPAGVSPYAASPEAALPPAVTPPPKPLLSDSCSNKPGSSPKRVPEPDSQAFLFIPDDQLPDADAAPPPVRDPRLLDGTRPAFPDPPNRPGRRDGQRGGQPHTPPHTGVAGTMLSIGKLSPGQQQYYLDVVARGAEEYYVSGKEAPGRWAGAGAEVLRLAGRVGELELHHVLSHRHPSSGERLTRAQGAPRVAGFDATFCAPKSVSLLFALGDQEVSRQVRDAHDAAVDAAFAVLETQSARARRGSCGATRVEGDGFAAAAFRHRTSRAADPHLHTHCVIANIVRSPADGRWSALDARALYAWARTAGYLYEAHLRAELTSRLGMEWGPVVNGIADIAGVPRATIREFSRRREEIEAHMKERGETSARAAQVATYATRRPKGPADAPEALLPDWCRRANTLGLDQRALAALTDHRRVESPEPGTEAAEALFTHLASPEGLTAQESTFGRREVLLALCAALSAGASVAAVEALANSFLASPQPAPGSPPPPCTGSSATPRSRNPTRPSISGSPSPAPP